MVHAGYNRKSKTTLWDVRVQKACNAIGTFIQKESKDRSELLILKFWYDAWPKSENTYLKIEINSAYCPVWQNTRKKEKRKCCLKFLILIIDPLNCSLVMTLCSNTKFQSSGKFWQIDKITSEVIIKT